MRLSDRSIDALYRRVEIDMQWLADRMPDDMAIARERMIKAEGMLKHIEALQVVAAGAAGAAATVRQHTARATDAYKAALDEWVTASGAWQVMQSRKDAAFMLIEMWRTYESSCRQGNRGLR
jgi:hypothetical protein